jgi:two-component system response regulator DesR
VPIRLAIVDDHPAIAAAISAAIAKETATDIEVVGVARAADGGVALVSGQGSGTPPDVVLCDIHLEAGIDGLRVLEAARAAGCRSIVLTAFDRSSLMRAAFERGALGFLDKGVEVDEILDAVRRVAAGGTAFSAIGIAAAQDALRVPSERELAILGSIGSGATSEEIGGRLGISGRTVESHLRRLFDRYGVVSRTELVVLAMREGWLDERR